MSAVPVAEASSERLLDATGVIESFGGVHAVRNVDLHVDRGEIVGLIGPNGSGKSTMLGCLSRDVDVDEGSISFEGRVIDRLGPSRVARSGIGRTFQNVRVFSELTVRQNAQLSRNWSEVGPLRMLGRTDQHCL
ncbi:ABC transporter-like protein [Nocardioides sp. CF8]|uniref:ATP-binding cassette domain-containing protein n=1 Tax=Nocardioides sp. CF8 TaxID=110319 RepID=UPI000330638A|nr:ATP-binding cassette domain-containing protein [Nocardioides sp. CF8]EON22140.1 ABC transporter-like protein [Nocardioides sp. CF8]